jgi:hypothetical protein
MKQSMKLLGIYNALLAGKQVNTQFVDSQAAEAFRVKLHQFKASQEKTLLATGIMQESEIPVLSFSLSPAADRPNVDAYIKFKPREETVYSVTIID